MYPLLTLAIATGMIATFGGNLVSAYHYREVVSPWFRGLFLFRPHAEEMANAPFLFQLHVTSVWLLYAVWPFSRLVHAWSIPLTYLQRSWILYRSRNPQAALALRRRRIAAERRLPGHGCWPGSRSSSSPGSRSSCWSALPGCRATSCAGSVRALRRGGAKAAGSCPTRFRRTAIRGPE